MKFFWPFLVFFPLATNAQDPKSHFEIEAGFLSTRNMEIRGFEQGSSTEGWTKSSPTFRLEYWRSSETGWNYGVVAQPLSLEYEETLTSNLAAKKANFRSGDHANLRYQFPTLRFSANKRLYQGEDGSYIRAGASAVMRYAKVALRGSEQEFSDTNFIAIPLINIEASRPLKQGYHLFTRSDFLPGIGGNALLDGLYDVYFGVRKEVSHDKNLDIGIRLFFGGYDPKKVDDYANRIFFNSVVFRYSF